MPPFYSRAPGMGCVFCKKLETGAKEDGSLEGDFRSYGAADRYGPDPTQSRPTSSFPHIPNYNSFSPQPASSTFLDAGTIRGISGESRGLEAGTDWTLAGPRGRRDLALSFVTSRMTWETQPCF